MLVIPLIIPSKEDPPPQSRTAQPESARLLPSTAAAAAMTTAEEEEFEPKVEDKVGWVLDIVCFAYFVLLDATKYVC